MLGVNGSGDSHGAPLVPVAIWKLLEENTSSTAGELHGVKSEVLVNSPHPGGVTSAACDPPLKDSLKFVNGTSGVSLNTVVNCPVLVFRCTSPTSLISTPCPASAISSFTSGGWDSTTYTLPSNGSASSGVNTVAVPTCDADGHRGGPS